MSKTTYGESTFRAWRCIAEELDGSYHDDSKSMLHRAAPGIEIDLGEARCMLDIVPVGGNSLVHRTRARASLPIEGGPKFRVKKPSALTSLGSLFGAEDIRLGELSRFDELFVVRCADAELTRRLWSRKAGELILEVASVASPVITSDGHLIEVVVDAVLDEKEDISHLIGALQELANADIFGLGALRDLPKSSTYFPPSGPWNKRTSPKAVVSAPLDITLEPFFEKRAGAVTRASAVGAMDDLECSIRTSSDVTSQDLPSGFPEQARAVLWRVGRAKLDVMDNVVVLTWPSIIADRDRLEAGVELVAACAPEAKRGAFR